MKYPKYAKLGECCLELHDSEKYAVYFRVAGDWNVYAKWENGKLISTGRSSYGNKLGHTKGKELIKCTKKEWEEDNGKYA